MSPRSNIRIFGDSFFHIVEDPSTCFDELQHDLNKISVWANQWRLRFNPDITKQAVGFIFSTKTTPLPHPSLMFNNIPVKLVNEHKHLGIILDKQLSFTNHINSKLSNAVLTLDQYIATSVSAVDNILPTSRKQMFYIPRQCFST